MLPAGLQIDQENQGSRRQTGQDGAGVERGGHGEGGGGGQSVVCTPGLQSGLSLTAAQIADCQEVFLLLDRDEDGKLSTRQHCYIHCCPLIST